MAPEAIVIFSVLVPGLHRTSPCWSASIRIRSQGTSSLSWFRCTSQHIERSPAISILRRSSSCSAFTRKIETGSAVLTRSPRHFEKIPGSPGYEAVIAHRLGRLSLLIYQPLPLCLSSQALVTWVFAGTPNHSEGAAPFAAGRFGAACWLILS